MFKDTVTYTPWDSDTKVTETLRFNISKTDILGQLALIDRFKAVYEIIQGDAHDLSTAEKQEILDVVKDFMALAYGVQTPDGKLFRKSPDVWDAFRWSAAYDEYLFNLFENPERAASFLFQVFPKDLRDAADEELREQGIDTTELQTPADIPTQEAPKVESDKPAWLLEGRAPTPEEFRVATPEQQFQAFQMKSSQ